MDKIIYKIKYGWYHFKLRYSALAITLAIFINLFITYLADHSRTASNNFISGLEGFENSLMLLSIRLVLVIICILSVILPIMIVHYRDVTDGRDCFQDMRDTGRTYWQLLRFYRNANPYKMDITDMPFGRWQDIEGVILGKVGKRIIRRSG